MCEIYDMCNVHKAYIFNFCVYFNLYHRFHNIRMFYVLFDHVTINFERKFQNHALACRTKCKNWISSVYIVICDLLEPTFCRLCFVTPGDISVVLKTTVIVKWSSETRSSADDKIYHSWFIEWFWYPDSWAPDIHTTIHSWSIVTAVSL